MATCNYCGKDAGYLHSICPECRTAQGREPAPTKLLKFRDNPLAIDRSAGESGSSVGAWVAGIGITLVILFILIMYFGNTPQAKEKGIKRMAIEQCWKDYERKSLDPSTKRFVTSVCEKLENDLKKQ